MRAALNHLRRSDPRNNRRNRRGANAVEFALTAPVLFFLILSTMDVGWFFGHSIALDHVTSVVAKRAGKLATHDNGTSAADANWTGTRAFGVTEWRKFGLPGSPTFVITALTVSNVDMLQVVGTVPYDDFGGWSDLLGGSLQVLPSNISVTLQLRAENELATPNNNNN